MSPPRRDSREPGGRLVSRRVFIVTWLWGLASLFAICGVLYHVIRERSSPKRRHRTEEPEAAQR